MKIGFVILCRYGSSRLPGKILADVSGRSVLSLIHERTLRGADGAPVVVATSLDPSDDPIAAHCVREKIPIFRGALSNVAERFYGAARHFGLDVAVRINGDNLFASPAVMRSVSSIVRRGGYDFVTNVKGRSYPTGMSVEAVGVDFYAKVLSSFHTRDHFEHVTLYLYEHEEIGRRYYLHNEWCPEARGTHMALDTSSDLERARCLFEQTVGSHLDYDLPDWHRMMAQTC